MPQWRNARMIYLPFSLPHCRNATALEWFSFFFSSRPECRNSTMLQNSLPSSFLCRMPDACKDAHLFDKTVAARRFIVVVVVVVVVATRRRIEFMTLVLRQDYITISSCYVTCCISRYVTLRNVLRRFNSLQDRRVLKKDSSAEWSQDHFGIRSRHICYYFYRERSFFQGTSNCREIARCCPLKTSYIVV